MDGVLTSAGEIESRGYLNHVPDGFTLYAWTRRTLFEFESIYIYFQV